MRSRGGRALVSGVLICAFVALAFCLNTAVRLPCYDVCGSDIGRLYQDRAIDRTHPPYLSRDLEYPPLIGVVMYAAGAPFDHGLRTRFVANMLILGGLAVAATWMLWRRNGRRAWRWALSPPLLIQGLTNWDLLSVAPATMGLITWERGGALAAGVLLGIGAAGKLFPALYVPILVAASLGVGHRRAALRVILGAALGFFALVVPVYAAAPGALRYFIDFQGDRGPDRGTVWYWLFRNSSLHPWLAEHTMVRIITLVTVVVLGAVLVYACVAAFRRRLVPFAACALALIACLLTTKIYSPQYDLWIVPFFVLLPIRLKHVVQFYVASTLVYVLTASDDHFPHRPASGYLLMAAVAYRIVLLVVIAVDLLRLPAAAAVTADAAVP